MNISDRERIERRSTALEIMALRDFLNDILVYRRKQYKGKQINLIEKEAIYEYKKKIVQIGKQYKNENN